MRTDCPTLLKQALEERMRANPAYSLRAFSRDLGMAPSTLSEVLGGKKGISAGKASAIASALKLPEWQKTLLCDLALRDYSKKQSVQKAAKARLEKSLSDNQMRLLNLDATKSLTSWIDLALLELTYLASFKPDTAWMAKKLGVSRKEIQDSAERMLRSGLLEIKNGKWSDISPLFTTTDGIPSESIRNFHRSVLNLALKKLENPDLRTRTSKSVIFSLKQADVPQARAILDEAIAKIVNLADRAPESKDSVQCFSAQLFSLTGDQS